MWRSLKKIRGLPDQTKIYCAHEYTLENGRFAISIERDNKDLQRYMDFVREKRLAGEPTLPTTLRMEKKINPFLRADIPSVQRAVGMGEGTDKVSAEDVFAKLRAWKDVF
jgi:hydroxyacylglutathione hydrolase